LVKGEQRKIGKIDQEKVKRELAENGYVYRLLGRFNFMNYAVHLTNFEVFEKMYVMIDFSHVLANDIDFFAQYEKFIVKALNQKYEEGSKFKYELCVTGISREQVLEDTNMHNINWIQRLAKEDRIFYTTKSSCPKGGIRGHSPD
jgi:hypothetical protein